ncbi:F-box/LRR-repeat protein 7 isoform X2 [Contarinia nasturtii]|uniref:F-box/LRR-repeat protein 7 isoform X2 n=1 Tax=Contarinia nasturtii TaxID=265458 RepID=UPI0012D3E66B|nr:F-box/LRR-repeat protein 7 isoform X2 [Contarinia nasturtii]
MSHRRAPPIECPLASLGHNLPSEHQYRHPLSSSPLNPNDYQMSSRKSPILNIGADGLIQFSAMHETDDSMKSTEDVSHLSSAINHSHNDTSDYVNIYRHPLQCLSTAGESDSASNYHQKESEDNSEPNENILNIAHKRNDRLLMRNCRTKSAMSTYNQTIDCGEPYFLENKMRSLFVHDAHTADRISTYPFAKTERSFDFEYGDSRLKLGRPTRFIQRPSSPSETSESDRYLLERTSQESPVNMPMSIARNAYNYLSNHQRIPSIPSSNGSHILVDGISSRLGRFSPSFDQGYHTLNSPSISAGANTNSQPLSHTARGRNKNDNIFNRLSDDVCIKIFSWLDTVSLSNVSRVCKRFDSLVWRPELWKTITLKGEGINGDRALRSIVRRLSNYTRNVSCPEIEKVMLSDGCRISDKGMELLSRRCPELTHLQIQMSYNVSNAALFQLVTKCTNLQHLDVTGCIQIVTIDFNHHLDPPRRLLLQFLDLTDCYGIDDSGLKTIVKNCPQLVYLYLRRCTQITDYGLKFVPSFCTALRELSVSDCVNITDFGLYELAKLGATLRYLSVAKCDQVSDAGLKVIARRCYKLRYLNCRGCEAVSDDSIIMLAHSCARLRALDIGKCDVSDAGLHALAESCPNLKKISLKNCDMITDRGIQCIAYYCRGLQHLNIQDCQISIEGYRAVKMYCKRCVIEHTNPGFG